MRDSDFEVVLADNDVARHIHYYLRYRVYCLETRLEEAGRFPDREEKDAFDARSVHFLVRARRTRQWIATIRLVFPNGNGGLPMESYAELDPARAAGICRESVAEVSRLAMLRSFCRPTLSIRRACDRNGQGHEFAKDRRLRVMEPVILVSLLRAVVVYCQRHGIRQLLFLITPALARLLTHLQIPFEVIGPPCRFRGLRYPCSADVERACVVLERRGLPGAASALSHRAAYRRFSELEPSQVDSRSIGNLQPTILSLK